MSDSSEPGRFSVATIIGLALALIGLWLGVSLAATLIPGPGVPLMLAGPGRFLVRLFAWAAFFVPLWLVAASIVTLLPGFRPGLIFSLGASIIPCLMLSAFARLSAQADAIFAEHPFLEALGLPAIGLGTGFVVIFISILIARLNLSLFPEGEDDFGEPSGDEADDEAASESNHTRMGAGARKSDPVSDPPRLPLLSIAGPGGEGLRRESSRGELPGRGATSLSEARKRRRAEEQLGVSGGSERGQFRVPEVPPPPRLRSFGEAPRDISPVIALGPPPNRTRHSAEEPNPSAKDPSSEEAPVTKAAIDAVGNDSIFSDTMATRAAVIGTTLTEAGVIPAAAVEPAAKAKPQASDPALSDEPLVEEAKSGIDEPIPLFFGVREVPSAVKPALASESAAMRHSSEGRASGRGITENEAGDEGDTETMAPEDRAGEASAAEIRAAESSAAELVKIDGAPPIEFTSVPPKPAPPDPAEVEKMAALARLLARKKEIPYAVPTDILTAYPDGQYWIVDDKTRRSAEVLRETLAEFKIEAEVTGIRKGPVITMFEILPAPGVKLSKITNLSDNIALRLAASSVRIVAPIPGKHAVGIEVPNERRSIVSLREMVENEGFKTAKMEVPVILGKDIAGEAQFIDLVQTPHLLIAGATGSGKSVSVNSIILSILYRRSPREVKLLLIDPKIVELKLYNDIPHLLTPVITEPKRAFQALQYCICEMERRYSMLDRVGVRDIKSYNRKIKEKSLAQERLPYIVVIVDEFADLMATTGKELESTLARLAAMSRAVGIHLVLATQRPSIDVITGLIKANIPSRIAFMVASKFDSRIIIDMVGAEKLLGKGDMLFASAWDPFPIRMQGAYVSEEEVERAVDFVKTLGEPEYIDEEIFIDDEEEEAEPSIFDDGDGDPLFEQALEIVLQQGRASASYIQRKLKIGYNRAARIVELMEERGIVGPSQGSKPRDLVRNPEIAGLRSEARAEAGRMASHNARQPLVANAETLPSEGIATKGAAASGGGLAEE